MPSEMTTSWAMLMALGAFHGINPGMGWLFAVALGMQQQRRSAVWRALPPIALGHAVSVALVVGLIVLAKTAVSHAMLKAADPPELPPKVIRPSGSLVTVTP